MAQAALPEYETILNELARTIRKHRHDCPPHETARILLEYDQPGSTTLVGVMHRGQSAALRHEGKRYTVRFDIHPDGLADTGHVVQDDGWSHSIFEHIESNPPVWTWVHPRYR